MESIQSIQMKHCAAEGAIYANQTTRRRGFPLKNYKFSALLFIMPEHHLLYEHVELKKIYLRAINHIEMATLKKV